MTDWLSTIPEAQRALAAAPLPRMQPSPVLWVQVTDSYAAQMAERDRLLAERPGDVVAMVDGGLPAAQEALEHVLEQLPTLGWRVGDAVERPDGVRVAIERERPLETLGHLISEDICVMEKIGDEHVLTGAVLCFPSSWTLAQKIGRPLIRIHDPVAAYNAGVAARVQRFFDGVRVGRPLQRANLLSYPDADLYTPRLEYEDKMRDRTARFWRSELQTLVRLPRTGAVVFGIHTTIEPG